MPKNKQGTLAAECNEAHENWKRQRLHVLVDPLTRHRILTSSALCGSQGVAIDKAFAFLCKDEALREKFEAFLKDRNL